MLIPKLYFKWINVNRKMVLKKKLESCCSNTEIQSIFLNGESREYISYIPDSYDGVSTIPLMLNFHGFGESAGDFMKNADMRTVSESNTFILVYPQGSCLNGSSHGVKAKEVGFLMKEVLHNF